MKPYRKISANIPFNVSRSDNENQGEFNCIAKENTLSTSPDRQYQYQHTFRNANRSHSQCAHFYSYGMAASEDYKKSQKDFLFANENSSESVDHDENDNKLIKNENDLLSSISNCSSRSSNESHGQCQAAVNFDSSNFLESFYHKNISKHNNTAFTASQFSEIWSHYDRDGNGYIEGKELDIFLSEFFKSIFSKDFETNFSRDEIHNLKKEFLEAFDKNGDKRIEIFELAEILPTDESFLLLFRRKNPLKSSVDFMRIWKQFDKDRSGFIEADELMDFLRAILREANPSSDQSEEKLVEYTTTMLELFDLNKDGKLQLSEMARLLPVKENYLCRPIFKNACGINEVDIDRVFSLYDQDGNGTIQDEELQGFLKDLLELAQEDYDEDDMRFFHKIILDQWDVNHDGKINRKELKMMLLHHSKLVHEDNVNVLSVFAPSAAASQLTSTSSVPNRDRSGIASDTNSNPKIVVTSDADQRSAKSFNTINQKTSASPTENSDSTRQSDKRSSKNLRSIPKQKLQIDFKRK